MTIMIDSHLKDINIILYNAGKIILHFEKKDVIKTSQYLLNFIKDIVDKYTITDIIVVNGPGSFTGIRLSVTISKTLAMCYNIPIRLVDTLKCFSISNNFNCVSLYDGNGYYIADFDDYNSIENYKYIDKKNFESLLVKYLVNPKINYKKVIEYCLKNKPINYHKANPIYIKEVI